MANGNNPFGPFSALFGGGLGTDRRRPPTTPGFTSMLNIGSPATRTAFETLTEILRSQGATDPRLFNQQLAQIFRGGQQAQDTARGELASAGLQQSGLGQALMAAIGQGTENRAAQARALEARTQEERMRQDLDLFLRMILQPGLQLRIGQIGEPDKPSDLENFLGAALPIGLGLGFGAGGFF